MKIDDPIQLIAAKPNPPPDAIKNPGAVSRPGF
jgi:hypothetical protein